MRSPFRRFPQTATLQLDPAAVGVACGLTSAIGYTAANICLRAVSHCDPVWVSTVKAAPTLVLFGPWLMILAARREQVLPPRHVMAALLASGVLAHLGGNVLFQWSLGVVGIALAVPLTLGTMIVGGAVLGWVWLHERVTPRAVLANTMLLAAIGVLAFGSGKSAPSDVFQTAATFVVYFGVLAACMSGLAYATLGVVIRYSVSGRARISSTMVFISLVGLVVLIAVTQARIGIEGMAATSHRDLATMVLAGVFNAGAFLALTRALQVTSVVMVNALNASQTAMALAAGVLLFREPLSATLIVGVTLTTLGLLLMGRWGNHSPSKVTLAGENSEKREEANNLVLPPNETA